MNTIRSSGEEDDLYCSSPYRVKRTGFKVVTSNLEALTTTTLGEAGMSAEQSTTTYRDVPGYPGYRVGDDGSVWSRHQSGGRGGLTNAWSRLKPTLDRVTPTYTRHRITIRVGGKIKQFFVHQLVLIAFVGPCPEGMECAHGDGNPENNQLTNLSWKTHQANMDDKHIHDTNLSGERHPRAKLTDAQIEAIKQEFQSMLEPQRLRCGILATRHGISYRHMYGLLCGMVRRSGTVAPKSTRSRADALITHGGVSLYVSEWAKKLNVKYTTLRYRITHWGVDKAIAYSAGG